MQEEKFLLVLLSLNNGVGNPEDAIETSSRGRTVEIKQGRSTDW